MTDDTNGRVPKDSRCTRDWTSLFLQEATKILHQARQGPVSLSSQLIVKFD